MDNILNVDRLSHTYQSTNGETRALKDVTFHVKRGEFVSIVGPSGCGKSTLLGIIADYKDIQTGYMMQTDNLLPWHTVQNNALFGLSMSGKKTKENIAYACSLLKTYGLWDFRNKYPAELSGGMRQRAALIRTLSVKPDLLLLDEAFSALDFQTRLAVADDVRMIIKNEKMTVLMVTHDIPEAISMSDRIVILTHRPGTVQSIKTIDFPPELTPTERREKTVFGQYFTEAWEQMSRI
jgi:ABC-type nitrate/sulfonate/bicarbonate transport system, ATPase component